MKKPNRLSDVSSSRDNNFSFLRLVAALAVLFSHSFVVLTGTEDAEPLRSTLGITWGTIAVDLFFVTSGFLVTASLLARKNILEFIFARALRIYPALIVMVLISVSVLGFFFTDIPIGQFLTDPATWTFALKNSTLWSGVTGYLPGVFSSVPYPNRVNASLWTMPFEIRMYAILAASWVLLYPFGRSRQRAFVIAIIALASIGLAIHFRDHFEYQAVDNFHRPPAATQIPPVMATSKSPSS